MRNGKWKKLCLVFLAFFAIVIFCSCSCSCSEEPELEISVNSLVIHSKHGDVKTGISVRKNKPFTISYTTAPTNAKIPGVYVKSKNPQVVMVVDDEMDMFTGEINLQATGVGQSIVTITSKDGGHERTCVVNVYEPTVLSTPQNVGFDGTKLVWDEVTSDKSGAPRLCDEKYKVTIEVDGTTQTKTVSDNELASDSSLTFEPEKQYSISVQALGDDVKNSNSAASAQYKFYILSTPYYEVNNGDIEWWFAKADGNANNPNFYKIEYNEKGDYTLVANPQNRQADNAFHFSDELLDINDFLVSIQAIKVPVNMIETDVRLLIDNAKEEGGIVHSITNGIDYISSKPTPAFNLHRTVPISAVSMDNSRLGNLTIQGMNFENAYQPSVLKFTGENNYYSGRIKYNLLFTNLKTKAQKDITLDAGVTEYELGDNFFTDVISVIGKNLQSPTGSVSYTFSNYSVKIRPTHADPKDTSSIILGAASQEFTFTYFEVPMEALGIKIDSQKAQLTYKNPTHNNETYFDGFQFVFVNATSENKDYKIVDALSETIDLKAALQGLQGSYQVFVNLKGMVASSVNLGSINRLRVKFQATGEEPEVIKTIAAPTGIKVSNKGVISWNGVEGAKEYRIELEINEATTYSVAVEHKDVANSYSLHKLLEDSGSSYDELTIGKDYNIRVISIAAEEGVIDSASNDYVFQKLNQVQNLKFLSNVISWDALSGASRYWLSINEGAAIKVFGEIGEDKVSVDITTLPREDKEILENAIYTDATKRNTIYVWAEGIEADGKLDSVPASIEVSKSQKPVIKSISNGRLVWDADTLTEGELYKVTILKAGTEENFAEPIIGISQKFFDLTIIQGTAELEVYVEKYSENTFISEKSSPMRFRRLSNPTVKIAEINGAFYLTWSKVAGAMDYQITGLTALPIIVSNTSGENFNGPNNQFEYRLNNIDETKEYSISLTARSEAEYQYSSDGVALVASKTITLSFVKLPKVKFTVGGTDIKWDFTDWKYYDKFEGKLSELYYTVGILNSQDEEVVKEERTIGQFTQPFKDLPADTYTVSVVLKRSVSNSNSSEYVLYSDASIIEITKLNTVELGISEDGRMVFDRTVEGEQSTDIAATDYYTIFANGNKLASDDYTLEEKDGKVYVSVTKLTDEEAEYSVIVRRPKELSGDKYFVNSNESTKLKAVNINIADFKKVGNNFEFYPAVLDKNGNDVAAKYIIEASKGYSYYKEITAGDEEYFIDGKYVVPVGSLTSGAGEYIFNIKVVGQEIEVDDKKIAYLGDAEGKTISVIVLRNPESSQILIKDGSVKFVNYVALSENKLEVPNKVLISFEKYNQEEETYEVFKEIELVYKDIKFENKEFDLGIAEDYLDAGEYKIYIQFIGDGNQIISSDKVQGNGGATVSKISQTRMFVSDGELCWNEVSGAKYRLYIDNNEEYIELTDKSENVVIKNGVVTLKTSDWEAGRKTLKIQVVKDGSLPSAISNEFVVEKLNKMTIKANSDNGLKVISWEDALLGASKQVIYMGEDIVEEISPDNSSWIITSDYKVGAHAFSMLSKGSVDTRVDGGIGYLTSDASNEVSINFIDPTVITSLKNGIVEWSEINGILTYEIALYKAETYLSEKELVSSNTIITTNATSFDLNDFGIGSGNYILEVRVATIDALEPIITSTHEEIETNFLRVIKIDAIGQENIYSNVRVEKGMFAFDITENYLEKYKELLKSINDEVELYDDLTLEEVVAIIPEGSEGQADEILYSLVNFNAIINNKKLLNLKPTSYSLMLEDGYLTLYYDIETSANTYEISFQPIGNTCSSKDKVVVGVLNGNATEKVTAVKPDRPISPVFDVTENSLVEGRLIWLAPSHYDGNYTIEFKEVKTSLVSRFNVSVVETLDPSEIWQAKIDANGKIQLDLNKVVEAGALKEGVDYVITIYTVGTEDSRNQVSTETKYLTGVRNTIKTSFVSLRAPGTFKATNGEIYWSDEESAIGYELNFYKYNSSSGEYDILVNGLENVSIEKGINKYNVVDDENLPAGRYRVEIKSKGDGNAKIDSKPKSAYFVKVNSVQIFVENGYFAFDEVNYFGINKDTGALSGSTLKAEHYQIRVVEVDGSLEGIEHEWLTETSLIKIGTRYYFELPDELNNDVSSYQLQVYVRGNNTYLLSGDTANSNYFTRSEIPTGFVLDNAGNISWTDTEDYYAVYVKAGVGSATRVIFGDKDYTVNNSFNINEYAAEQRKYGEYEVYVKALHNNPVESEDQLPENTYLISSKSITIRLNVIEPPVIKLENGDINWQSASFETLKQEITNSYLIIKGKIIVNNVLSEKEETIKIRCSYDAPLFVNNYYYASVETENSDRYYSIDLINGNNTNTRIALAGGQKYTISVQYIGYTGDLEEYDGEKAYLCSSANSASVSDVECLTIPTGVQGATKAEVSGFEYSNYVRWNKVANSSGYEVLVYKISSDGEKSEYGRISSLEYAELFAEQNNYAYFAMDDIIKEFALEQNVDTKVSVQVKAIGSTWNINGVGMKKISSNYSSELNVEYPSAPTNLAYNGAGLISWTNNADATAYIKITYVPSVYYRDAQGSFTEYMVRGKGLNYNEIISREVEGSGSYIATDIIEIGGVVKGTDSRYQLKYLTDNILSIKVWVETTNFVSVERILSSTGTNPQLTEATKKFMLFTGGDGSTVSPFKIKNIANLKNISHYLDSHFIVIDNIALTGTIAPIGSKSTTSNTAYDGAAKAFSGSINGDIAGTNAKITNVKLAKDDRTDVSANLFGLFYAVADGASISNIDVEFANGDSQRIATNRPTYIGGLVATENRGTISNVNVSGDIYVSGDTSYPIQNMIYLAGIAKDNYGTITGTESGATVNVNLVVTTGTNSYIGGVVYENNGTISHYGVGEVTLKASSVGGIAHTNAGIIEYSYSKAEITLDGGLLTGYSSARVGGGLVGITTSDSVVTKSYSDSTINVQNMSSSCYVGALAAITSGGDFSNIYVSMLDGGSIQGRFTYLGKVYGNFAGGTGFKIYYYKNNIGTKIAYSSINSNDIATGAEIKADMGASSYLAELNTGAEGTFVARGADIKLYWEV